MASVDDEGQSVILVAPVKREHDVPLPSWGFLCGSASYFCLLPMFSPVHVSLTRQKSLCFLYERPNSLAVGCAVYV